MRVIHVRDCPHFPLAAGELVITTAAGTESHFLSELELLHLARTASDRALLLAHRLASARGFDPDPETETPHE